jgi:hypothetical protein
MRVVPADASTGTKARAKPSSSGAGRGLKMGELREHRVRLRQRRLEPGETLIEQWDAGRDCFVILDA